MATRVVYPPLPPGSPHSEIVRHYIRFRRIKLHEELDWFASRPSFQDMLDEAVHARDKWGKRLSHQRRLLKHVIPTAYALLKAKSGRLQRAGDFDDLFGVIDGTLGPIPNSGDLYAYDIALRIGAYLMLYPTRVYLQTGAMTGARKISRTYRARSVPLALFPAGYHCLAPFEMENLLCCNKRDLHP